MIYNVWLNKLEGIGPVKARKIIDYMGSARDAYNASAFDFMEIEGIGLTRARIISESKALDEAEIILKNCDRNNIKTVKIDDPLFPSRLKSNDHISPLLYYKGTLREPEHIAGIVGSRMCSQTGKAKTVELVKQLERENVAIVSGMAKGIDSYAHTVAINEGGYTIAVLAYGLDQCYPKEHDYLMQRIEETGLIISEYEPEAPPTRYTFPRRNRIIAALSDTLYIPEKGTKSGTNTTIDFAHKLEKEVLYL